MEQIDDLMRLIMQEAAEREILAGQSGSISDGGASKLRDQVLFYKLGRKNEMPSSWQQFLVQLKKEADLEYPEYLRLKEKFKE